MKTSHLVLAAALAGVASTSMATQLYHPSVSQEEGVKYEAHHLTGGTSRNTVQQSVLLAQRDGSLHWISRGYPPTYPLVKGPSLNKSRQQVQDELRAWQRNPVSADGMRYFGGELGWVDARQAN
jgi:hypothetical protein